MIVTAWSKLRYELRSPAIDVAATSVDELERFDFRGSADTCISKLHSIFRDSDHLDAVFAHMITVVSYLGRLNVNRRMYINPLSSYNEHFYRGNLLFQCLFDQKRRSVFAAGGRYDQLVRQHQPIASRRPHIHAVGCQLAWTGLCNDVLRYLRKSAKSKTRRKSPASNNDDWRRKRYDVLVKSFDRALLDSIGIEILHQLWANDISSDISESDTKGSTVSAFMMSQGRTEDHIWLVLIKSEDLIKVRNTSRNDEIELKLPELIGHLRSEMRERERAAERAAKVPLLRHTSQPESQLSTNDRETDVQILTSQNKGKKVNRKTIIEEGELIKTQE